MDDEFLSEKLDAIESRCVELQNSIRAIREIVGSIRGSQKIKRRPFGQGAKAKQKFVLIRELRQQGKTDSEISAELKKGGFDHRI